jgi:predicted PurR-regulated permease PerM
MTTVSPPSAPSPSWSSTAKLVFGLTFVAVIIALVISLKAFIGPALLAIVVVYLLYPVVSGFSRLTRIPWKGSVAIIYLVFLAALIALSTWAGVTVAHQVESLVGIIQQFIEDIPRLAEQFSSPILQIGPYTFDLSQYLNLNTLSDQLLQLVQPALTQVTRTAGTLATGAVETVAWGGFTLLVSFFVLTDLGQRTSSLDFIRIPGYDSDIRRMGVELGRIWNAFLRGQVIIFVLVVLAYTVLMLTLGVRFAFGIALLAGFARFVPYVGPLISSIVTILVSLFQGGNYFGLEPVRYAVMVIIAAVILDQIFDNFISPQIMGQTLRVQPAAVLVGAIVAANLIGVIGLVLAAPVVATLKLLITYILRKILDLDPWEYLDQPRSEDVFGWVRLARRVKVWLLRRFRPQK